MANETSLLNPPKTAGSNGHSNGGSPVTETVREHAHGQRREPYIEFKDVSKAFGSNKVLDHVSFDVLPGETLCILGRSGVGKSVSLHHIMGFLKPDSGRVIVAYQDVTDFTEAQMEPIRK